MKQTHLQLRLKQALDSDLWNIINRKNLLRIDFYSAVQEEMLGGSKMNMLEVAHLARELESKYNETLSFFHDGLSKNICIDILDLITATNRKLYENIRITINEVELLRKRNNGKLRLRKWEETNAKSNNS